MLRKKIIVVLLLCLPSSVYAQTIDVNLSSSSARISVSNYDDYSELVHMEGSFFWNEKNKSHLLSYGVSTIPTYYSQEKQGHKSYLFNIGLQFMLLNFEYKDKSQTGLGLGLGVEFSKDLELKFAYPVRFTSAIYYAPSVVIISNEIESIYTLNANLEMLLQENAIVYTGLSYIGSNLEVKNSHTIHSGVHIGVKILF